MTYYQIEKQTFITIYHWSKDRSRKVMKFERFYWQVIKKIPFLIHKCRKMKVARYFLTNSYKGRKIGELNSKVQVAIKIENE